jgi:3-methyladenine DNA glycosylase/8-oxoguanine DNA glycosylase
MIISEAYLRVAPDLDAARRRQLGRIAFEVAERGAQEFFTEYGTKRVAEVIVEEGSTKLWARLRAPAFLLVGMQFLDNYGSIRSGLDQLLHDGRAAAGWMADHIEPLLPGRREYRQRRAPAAARFRRLFDSVAAGKLTVAEATEKAEEILREYGESEDAVHTVAQRMNEEFRSIGPQTLNRFPKHERRPQLGRPTAIRAARRLTVFRDSRSGELVIVEN